MSPRILYAEGVTLLEVGPRTYALTDADLHALCQSALDVIRERAQHRTFMASWRDRSAAPFRGDVRGLENAFWSTPALGAE
jgi:hypothetical protein